MAIVERRTAVEHVFRAGTNPSHFVWLLGKFTFYETSNGWLFAFEKVAGTVLFALEPVATAGAGTKIPDDAGWEICWAELVEVLAPARTAFVAIGEEMTRLLGRHGFSAIEIGKDPWVHAQGYEPRGNAAKGVRAARNQAVRGGAAVKMYGGDELSAKAKNDILRLHALWDDRNAFSVHGFLNVCEPLLEVSVRRYFFVGVEERTYGVLVASPIGSTGDYYLEDLFLDPDAPNGSGELLILEAIEKLALLGAKNLSLGVVALGNFNAPAFAPAGPGVRAVLAVVRWLSRRVYSARGIELNRKRFRPNRWEPVYMAIQPPRLRTWILTTAAVVIALRPKLRMNGSLLRISTRNLWRKHGVLALLTVPSAILFALINHFGKLPASVISHYAFTASAPASQWMLRSIVSDVLYFDPVHFLTTNIGFFLVLWRMECRIPKRLLLPMVLAFALSDDIVHYTLFIKPIQYLQPGHFGRIISETGVGASVILAGLVGFWLQYSRSRHTFLFVVFPFAITLGLVIGARQFEHFVFNLDHLLYLTIGEIVGLVYGRILRRQSRGQAKGATPKGKLALWAGLCVGLLFSTQQQALATTAAPNEVKPAIEVSLPAVDTPFNFDGGYRFPSMRQSLDLSDGFYQTIHYAVLGDTRRERPTTMQWLGASAFDLISLYVPLGSAWVHEEWHRAMLMRRGIGSFDDVYYFRLFQGTISVSHETDGDLANLKQQHPSEFVRLSAAGIEANYEQNLALQKESFFNDSRADNHLLYVLNDVSNIAYMFTCAGSWADSMTDEFNREDGAEVSKRDFTGLDCTAWAYDLDRPNEPYSARGVHPSGAGINRYRKFSDLSADEQAYLRKQSWLSLINLVDPFLIGKDSFGEPDGTRWNANARYHLTSFGTSLEANVFWRRSDWNVLAIPRLYFNGVRPFPGIEAQLLRKPIEAGAVPLLFSARLMMWLQPQDQLFLTERASAGALASVQVGWQASRRVEPFMEIEGKSAGWVAGNAYLDANLSARAGVTVGLF